VPARLCIAAECRGGGSHGKARAVCGAAPPAFRRGGGGGGRGSLIVLWARPDFSLLYPRLLPPPPLSLSLSLSRSLIVCRSSFFALLPISVLVISGTGRSADADDWTLNVTMPPKSPRFRTGRWYATGASFECNARLWM